MPMAFPQGKRMLRPAKGFERSFYGQQSPGPIYMPHIPKLAWAKGPVIGKPKEQLDREKAERDKAVRDKEGHQEDDEAKEEKTHPGTILPSIAKRYMPRQYHWAPGECNGLARRASMVLCYC